MNRGLFVWQKPCQQVVKGGLQQQRFRTNSNLRQNAKRNWDKITDGLGIAFVLRENQAEQPSSRQNAVGSGQAQQIAAERLQRDGLRMQWKGLEDIHYSTRTIRRKSVTWLDWMSRQADSSSSGVT